MIELVLFENDPASAKVHIEAGINTFLIDTEVLGKDLRQLGFDTEIRPGAIADLEAISSIPEATTWCRINRLGAYSRVEIHSAINAGASVLLLPMATTLSEVESFLDIIDGKCQAAIMIETTEGAAISASLRNLPLEYVFFGLNDFAISRGGGSIFRALADGSVEVVRQALPEINFGVGGLTDVGLGSPIPSAKLLEEMERLGCSFTFLRRSFRRDAKVTGPKAIVDGIRAYWNACSARSDLRRLEDQNSLVAIIREIESRRN